MKNEELIKEIPWLQCTYSDGEPIPGFCYIDDIPTEYQSICIDAFKKINDIVKKKETNGMKYRIVDMIIKNDVIVIKDNLNDDDVNNIISELNENIMKLSKGNKNA